MKLNNIIFKDIESLSKEELAYFEASKLKMYTYKKNDEIIYVFRIYTNSDDCAVSKYIYNNDTYVNSSLEEMNLLKCDYNVSKIE